MRSFSLTSATRTFGHIPKRNILRVLSILDVQCLVEDSNLVLDITIHC